MSQILAIIYYEFRMSWRQRTLLVMTLALLVITLSPLFLIYAQASERGAVSRLTGTNPTAGLVQLTYSTSAAVVALLMPIVFAELIPRDRQLKVRDLLLSTPLSSTAYLTGKVLSAWLIVASSMLVVSLAAGVSWWAVFGAFTLSDYVEAWLLGVLPLIIINLGIIVLIASLLPTNRMAVLAGLIFSFVFSPLMGFAPQGDWRDLVNPLRPGIFYRYASVDEAFTLPSFEATVAAGLIQLGLIWLVIWLIYRYGVDHS